MRSETDGSPTCVTITAGLEVTGDSAEMKWNWCQTASTSKLLEGWLGKTKRQSISIGSLPSLSAVTSS
eukprot:1258744-Rhodomonas_salina.6